MQKFGSSVSVSVACVVVVVVVEVLVISEDTFVVETGGEMDGKVVVGKPKHSGTF